MFYIIWGLIQLPFIIKVDEKRILLTTFHKKRRGEFTNNIILMATSK